MNPGDAPNKEFDFVDFEAIQQDREKASELMEKMERSFVGYNRLTIVIACSRTIAAMFGPAKKESRDNFLQRFPAYMHSMWRLMDQLWQ